MPGRSFTIPRNQARNKEPRRKNQQKPISETCPKNSTISSTHESPTTPIAKKKKNFTPFRATSQVSVPVPIADWQSKKKKQKLRIKTLKFVDGDSTFSTHNSCCRKGRKARHSCMAASFDDFVVSRKPHSAKERVDIGKITPVEVAAIPRYVPVKFYPAIVVFFPRITLTGGRTDCPDRYRSLRLN
ncbi:hypothetical protein KY290_010506 [Solanum tuberosum]|uniref:Uncharacterized protein n=1 Tax=Solanum tuberosum TaxID=4113 RepID=A0ABQ7W063_SOLTU|nr:hypothetical protein KY284_010388 [Solanum tuberosum]KAH0773369.1 hypothetical protein KY290_010506 [Solanum tuberosum]